MRTTLFSTGYLRSKSLTTLLVVGALLLASTTAMAQTYGYVAPPQTGYGYNYNYRNNRPWGGWGYHSSTYEEGVLRGAAEYQRATGEANLYNSMAAEHYESARQAAIENKKFAADTYFAMRKANQEARDAARPKRLTVDQYADIAMRSAPSALAAQQYEPMSGKLAWPDVLMSKQFDADRKAIDDAFRSRDADDGGKGSNFAAHIDRLTSRMEADLKANIDQLNPMDYMAARKFLGSVAHEAQQFFDLRAVATR